MPHKERAWAFRVEDILEAAEKIKRYTAGIDYKCFTKDTKTIDAVVRNLEIIGETSSNIPKDIQKKYPEVEWKEMQGMRNILAHEYFGINSEILWQTIKDDLPHLLEQVKKLRKL